MTKRRKSWLIALALCLTAALTLGTAVVMAQEASTDAEAAEGAEASASVDSEFWASLDAVIAELDEQALADIADADVQAKAQAVVELLEGENGLIPQMEASFGLVAADITDPQAVITAGTDAPEKIALAHLLLAAQELKDAPDKAALLTAGQYVAQANTLLADLRPADAATDAGADAGADAGGDAATE